MTEQTEQTAAEAAMFDDDTRLRVEARFTPRATRNREHAEKALARVEPEQPAAEVEAASMPDGWEDKPLPDAETKRALIADAAAFFRLTPHMAARLDGATVREIAEHAVALAREDYANAVDILARAGGRGTYARTSLATDADPIRAARHATREGWAVNEIQTTNGTRFIL